MKKKKPKKEKVGRKEKLITKKSLIASAVVTVLVAVTVFFVTKSVLTTVFWAVLLFGVFNGYQVMKVKLKESAKVKKMEAVFPEFLQLMSSNLRAGMTTDKAILLSARKEFDPLDKEIMRLGKELFTGNKIEDSLLRMGERIGSEKIKKTINLIVSGVRAGGNISVLLEQTATSIRERSFVEKRSASNVLMYVIFIFFALAFGAPALFGLSSVLIEVLSSILSNVPDVQSSGAANLPFTLSEVTVSPEFVKYFALVFLIVIDILGALVLGLVSKGEEKAGLKYVIPLLAIGLAIFFLVRVVLGNYFAGFLA